jgi:hypothetical protein
MAALGLGNELAIFKKLPLLKHFFYTIPSFAAGRNCSKLKTPLFGYNPLENPDCVKQFKNRVSKNRMLFVRMLVKL